MHILPLAPQSDIIVQDIDQELLIYKLKTNQIVSLNETSKTVYQNCNGQTSFDELKTKYHYSDDLIFLSLDELKKHDLIDDSYQAKFNGVSRREIIKRVGLASMIALPVISSLIAPSGVQAASGSCLPIGVCIPLGTNYCAACAGRTLTYTTFGQDRTCSNAEGIGSVACGSSSPSNIYFMINSIT